MSVEKGWDRILSCKKKLLQAVLGLFLTWFANLFNVFKQAFQFMLLNLGAILGRDAWN